MEIKATFIASLFMILLISLASQSEDNEGPLFSLPGSVYTFDGTPSEILTDLNIAEVFGVSSDIITEEYGQDSISILVKDEI